MIHRPLVPVLSAFTGGLFAGRLLAKIDPALFLLLALPGLPTVLVWVLMKRPASFTAPSLLILFFLAGLILDLGAHKQLTLEVPAARRDRFTLEGTVLEPPRREEQITRLVVRADRVLHKAKELRPGELVYVSIYRHGGEYAPGDRIRFSARLRPFRNFNNPGRYDYERAMRIRGFSCGASISDGRCVVFMGKGDLGFPWNAVEAARGPLRSWIRQSLASPARGIVRALLLGEKHDLDPELREAFYRTGLAHILAVSGLHVGLVAWLVFGFVTRLLSCSYRLLLTVDVRKAAALITCLAAVAYALVAGFQVSTQRALAMVLAYLISIAIGRERDVWSTLCLAALLVLASDPHALYTISFQLSFGAVVGILWLAPPIYKRIYNNALYENGRRKRALSIVHSYTAGLLSVTVAAALFLLPLTVYYFHRISPVTVISNLAATPLLGLWILPAGLLAMLFFPVFPGAAGTLLNAASAGAEALEIVVRLFSGLSWASFWTVTPNPLELVLLYALLASVVLALKGRLRLLLPAVCLLLALDAAYWLYETRLSPHLRVTYLDVGQGNSALVQFPGGKRMLIDGGGFRLGTFDVGEMVVAPFLWSRKITRVHYLVLSHPEADHMDGLSFIAENFHPQDLWYNGDRVESDSYRRFMAAVLSTGLKLRLPGDPRLPENIGGVDVEVLYPPPGRPTISSPDTTEDNLNDRSLVIRLSQHGSSFLFPGDLESKGEAELAAIAGHELKSTVLLAPHHGSSSSSTPGFLECVRPEWCVISAGAGNRFGFPHPEALDRIRSVGARILRLDRIGAIRLTVKDQTLFINYSTPYGFRRALPL
ncbi:MAG: DNA internalization-related competence protein ComEC/Rec2 [Desulfobacteraceae bacterium]